jgi:hypothetical protein
VETEAEMTTRGGSRWNSRCTIASMRRAPVERSSMGGTRTRCRHVDGRSEFNEDMTTRAGRETYESSYLKEVFIWTDGWRADMKFRCIVERKSRASTAARGEVESYCVNKETNMDV